MISGAQQGALTSRIVIILVVMHRETGKPGSSKAEEVVWFRQTINNACGLYAILHAICNFDVRRFIGISIMLVEESFD